MGFSGMFVIIVLGFKFNLLLIKATFATTLHYLPGLAVKGYSCTQNRKIHDILAYRKKAGRHL